MNWAEDKAREVMGNERPEIGSVLGRTKIAKLIERAIRETIGSCAATVETEDAGCDGENFQRAAAAAIRKLGETT
ncbi:MAG: hypothetical protein EPN98_21825 [Phenylobacterium sp.]|uniref:hypothetical protein n=1 Tax=Phenylobacterium sp. TaxID=1871053 RepID=UPI001205BAB5|nr:hypothetical protein [Phenylobacterium sp.]TAL29082.1 MAG: hypothetical protein EPN98_21825 [Phenylobacterium sp.]